MISLLTSLRPFGCSKLIPAREAYVGQIVGVAEPRDGLLESLGKEIRLTASADAFKQSKLIPEPDKYAHQSVFGMLLRPGDPCGDGTLKILLLACRPSRLGTAFINPIHRLGTRSCLAIVPPLRLPSLGANALLG